MGNKLKELQYKLLSSVLKQLAFVVLCASPALSNGYAVDVGKIEGLPTAGPNCYFTALSVNNLLKVPATTISDGAAAILFLNPALCVPVTSPQPGDIGLEENMSQISHVFTVITSQVRYEKAGPLKTDVYGYFEMPMTSASQFVRCAPMQGWISKSIASTNPDLVSLELKISELEQLIDLRNGPKSPEKGLRLRNGLAGLGSTAKVINELRTQLQEELVRFGVSKAPYPGMLNGEYFQFAKTRPELLSHPKIFTLLWLSVRLQALDEAAIYYAN